MSFWMLAQIFFNLILITAVIFTWIKLNRPAKDDPRLSKGLQLLQSKISILEDLSDRTEQQVKQLTALIEQKSKDVHYKIEEAEKVLREIEQAKSKSLEVAKIFQDKIPHKEIIERQNTIKFVKAAKLAHQGYSVDEIAEQVDLTRGEIEIIAKVNKNQLMFDDSQLPDWVDESEIVQEEKDQFIMQPTVPKVLVDKKEALKNLGDRFRQAMDDQSKVGESLQDVVRQTQDINNTRKAPQQFNQAQTVATSTGANTAQSKQSLIEGKNQSGKSVVAQKVIFPRLDMTE